jgi:predicted esterase
VTPQLPRARARLCSDAVRRLVHVLVMLAVVLAAPAAFAKASGAIGDPQRLEVPGQADAYFYRPRGKGMRPVIMYLHGRGGNPAEECRKWARVGTQFGWVVCPSGPEDRGGGGRGWSNSVPGGKQVTDATLQALRAKYKRRVQLRGNLLIGFSEGAFIAMQLGIHDPSTWSRWLILAANDQYWWGDAPQLLDDDKKKLRRVYLLTGESDEVAPNTRRVGDMLKTHKIPYKMRIVPGMGHEVPGDRMITVYRRPLAWLTASK